jgi:hypothetical protein
LGVGLHPVPRLTAEGRGRGRHHRKTLAQRLPRSCATLPDVARSQPSKAKLKSTPLYIIHLVQEFSTTKSSSSCFISRDFQQPATFPSGQHPTMPLPPLAPTAVSLASLLCVHTPLPQIVVARACNALSSRISSPRRPSPNDAEMNARWDARFRAPLLTRSYHQSTTGSKREELYRWLRQSSENEKAMDQAEHAIDMGKSGSLSDATQPANVPPSQIITAIRANTADLKLQSAIRDLLSNQKSKEEFEATLASKLDAKFANLVVANLKDDISAELYQAMTKKFK